MSNHVTFAFSVGMLATINPCGFVLLPTYLTYFLGVEGARPGMRRAGVGRALLVSLAVSLGFFAVFLAIGLATQAGFTQLRDEGGPWFALAVGVLLLAMGIATLFGIHLPVFTPKLDAGGRSRSFRSMFVYGMAYAIASIGCTLPTFVGAVLGQVPNTGIVSGIIGVAAYGLGMGLVLSALTVSLALASTGLLKVLRRVMAHIDLFAGAVLILAGLYLLLYGWVELDPIKHRVGVVDTVLDLSQRSSNFVSDHRGTLALAAAAITAAAIGASVVRARQRTVEA